MTTVVKPAQALLSEIEVFLAAAKMAESTFGRKAVNDGKLVGRLRAGKSVTIDSADAIRRFIAHAQVAA